MPIPAARLALKTSSKPTPSALAARGAGRAAFKRVLAATLVLGAGFAATAAWCDSTPPVSLSSAVLAQGSPTSGSPALSLRLLAEHGGRVSAVTSDAERIYIARGSRILVLDADAAPDAPPRAQTAPLGSPITALAVRDGLLVAGSDILAVFDTGTMPPRLLGTIPLHERPREIVLAGGESWLLGGRLRPDRISLADPMRPRRIGPWLPEAPDPNLPIGEVTGLAADEAWRYALVRWSEHEDAALGPSVSMELVAMPLSPGGEAAAEAASDPILVRHDPGLCCQLLLAAEDGRVAVLDWDGPGYVLQLSGSASEGYAIERRSTLARPSSQQRLSAIRIHNNVLWRIDSLGQVWRQPGLPNPTFSPHELVAGARSFELAGIAALDDRLLVATQRFMRWLGPEMREIEGPQLPQLHFDHLSASDAGAWMLDENGAPFHSPYHTTDVPVPATLAFEQREPWLGMIANDRHLFSFDTSDVFSLARDADAGLQVTGRIPVPLGNADELQLLDAEGDWVAMGDRRGTFTTAAHVGPEELTTWPAPLERVDGRAPFVRGTALDQERLWLLRSTPSLQAYELSAQGRAMAWPLADPFRLASPAAQTGLSVEDGIGRLTSGSDLVLVNLRNPLVPRELALLDMPGTIRALAGQGRWQWLTWATLGASGSTGFAVVDVGNPQAPQPFMRPLPPGGPWLQIAAHGSRAWLLFGNVTAGEQAMQVWEIWTPPEVVARAWLPWLRR